MTSDAPGLAKLLGGRLGSRAQAGGIWFTAGPWAFLALSINFVALMIRQLPCQAGQSSYLAFCYSDIRALWYFRGLKDGQIPFLQGQVEYPVLTGAFMEVGRRLVVLFGGTSAPDITASQAAYSAQIFMGVTSFLLFVLFGVLVWAHLKMHRPWDALMIAASPAILTTGLINWDALVLALTSLSLLAWARKKPIWSGIWLGLAISAKLYPGLLLIPLVVLAARAGKWRQLVATVAATVASWVAVNLPVYLANPQGWSYFWTFNADRGPDFGSIWYALNLAGVPQVQTTAMIDDLGMSQFSALIALLMVTGTLAIVAVLLLAPNRPRLAQGAFLIVALFLVVNKVYSPQYVLWLLPLMVLARPKWLDWIVFSIAETLYYVAIWARLDGYLSTGMGQDKLYLLAVFLRIGVVAWLSSRVLIDIFRPQADPVRAGGLDDPDGGVLDTAADAGWLVNLRHKLMLT